jgi:hypothetical protein
MKRPVLAALLALQAAAWAQVPADFAWRAQVEPPRDAALARIEVPAGALMQAQSATLADLRMFDAAGKPVPFALRTPQSAATQREPTRRFDVLPLYGAQPGEVSTPGLQVRIDQQSVWVQSTPQARPAGRQRLPSVLVDMRSEKRALSALRVHATLGPNRPVDVQVSTSDDLAQWTPVRVKGRLYRFEGESAPANDTLEFDPPLRVEGRYLRLAWGSGELIGVEGVTGLVGGAAGPVARVAATLATPRNDGPSALEWDLGFATPIRAIELVTEKPITLVPVRVLGRNAVSEPWRQLGQTVIWRLGTSADQANPALLLGGASVRMLRVEATYGMRLQELPLAARVVFDPVDVVFVASGEAPYTLAVGRPATASAALPLTMLAGTTSVRPEDLPLARLTEGQSAVREGGGLARFLPRGIEPRVALLWAVLGGGVLVLGAVAWALLRQMRKGGSPGP